MRIIEWELPGGVPCRPACKKKTYEAKSLQLSLTACCLAPTVLNIWSYLRLPDVCYPVVDLPCRSGIYTRWNYRPCSAAHPFVTVAALPSGVYPYRPRLSYFIRVIPVRTPSVNVPAEVNAPCPWYAPILGVYKQVSPLSHSALSLPLPSPLISLALRR